VAFALGSVVDARFVANAMKRGAIVWDVRPTEAYFDGHLPGAVTVGFVGGALLDEKSQLFLPIEAIAARLGDAGLDLQREIVIYGGGGSAYPYFAQFALEYFGARRVHVYHDGFEGWKAAKRPVSTAAVKRKAVPLRPFANPALLVTTGEVLAHLERGGAQFVDTRGPAEFTGGHIPGAVNIPSIENLDDRPGTGLKSRAALRKLYGGLDRHRETVVYGHSGVGAAMTAVILARLGFTNVRLYHASWLEYGNRPDAPVER
jgi:thiosulfate/3-mercaptopyruvate sulfurtransferase